MKKLFVVLLIALTVLSALPSFSQPIPWGNRRYNSYWNNQSNHIRPRPVLRADQGLGVNEWRYGGHQNFMDPRWSTIVPQPITRADQGLGVHDWMYEVYSRQNSTVYAQQPSWSPYGQNQYNDPYDYLRHYYNQPPPNYRFPNQGIIQLLQPPGYYSPYRQRPSNVTIILDALLNNRR